VTVAVECEDVSGVKECAAYFPFGRRWGFAGTAVWVELVEAEELEGVGEDGREGVGVMAEEDSVGALVGGWEEVVGGVGVGAGEGGSTAGF
jgi:hypothetical protein